MISGLEGFFWVAETGGYASAARAFPRPITQPAVYQQVRRLEDELGVDLVERGPGRSLRLTVAGEQLHGFCAPFFRAWPETLERIQSVRDKRRLNVAASGLVLRQLIPSWVQALARLDPERVIEIEELETPDWDRLHSGQLDLLIDFFPNVPSGIETEPVAEAIPFVVIPENHPAARSCPLDLTRLRGTPLVSYHPSLPQHRLQLEAARRYVAEPDRQVSASSVDIIVAFVAANMGYSLVPWLDEQGPERPGVVCRAMLDHPERYPVVAAWSSRNPSASSMPALVAPLKTP